MLQEIHIQNYAVVESLTVEFHPGFNVLTGETGSGKSILVDALDLALGGRASPDVIRTGADRAAVTAVFRAEASGRRGAKPPWRAWLEQYGVRGEAEAEIILRREVQAGGRSRLLVNDEPVTLAAARELAPLLVEIHGQGEHALLLVSEHQLDLLDEFARDGERLHQIASLYTGRRELEREWSSLNQSEQDRLRALDLLRFQVQELASANLQPGEDARLESEREVLRNLEKVRAAAAKAHQALYEDEGSALARLAAADRALDELGRYEKAFESHREPLAAARVTLDELARALGDYLGKLDADPARLEEISDRLALFDRLKRKYGASVDEILAFAGRARDDLLCLEHADERRSEVRRRLESACEVYRKAAAALSSERQAASAHFASEVQGELAQLGMDKARFAVSFDDAQAARAAESLEDSSSFGALASGAGGPKGIDRITFLVSPNPGEDLRPLDRVASGGETSRLMLAIKTVIAEASARADDRVSFRTLVFDEVDAGIGGQVAASVGERLKRLAKQNQVLSVTHLPQIACFADHHYVVEKIERAGRTFAEVQYLEAGRERTAELARMLSGRHITAAVLDHAAAMLKQGSRR
jgi:DNA repair protein RecN (Recombination protein N)